MAPSFINPYRSFIKGHKQQSNAYCNMKPMESRYKKEQLGERCRTILVHIHIGPVYRFGYQLIQGVYVGQRGSILSTMDKVGPFPGLTAQKGNASQNCPKQPFYYIIPISSFSSLHGQNHGN